MEIAIALVAVLAGIVVPILLHRREHPKRALRYRIDSKRLLTEELGPANPLAITLGDRVLSDPHSVRVTIWSVGRADISTSAFDSDRPLIIDLGASIVDGTVSSHPGIPAGAVLSRRSDRELQLGPILLPKNAQVTADLISEEMPRPTVQSPLIDIEVAPDRVPPTAATVAASRRRNRVTSLQITLGITVAAVILLIVALALFAVDRSLSAGLGAAAILILGACIIALVVIAVVRLVRLIRSMHR